MDSLPENDHAVYFHDHDAVIEAEAECNGPDFGPPESWPSWCDDRWVPTEPVPDPDSYDTWLDRINEINQGRDDDGRLNDRDIETATGCAG
jgi:hypothetical protein